MVWLVEAVRGEGGGSKLWDASWGRGLREWRSGCLLLFFLLVATRMRPMWLILLAAGRPLTDLFVNISSLDA